jgi:opacity protein-like surface antigen
MAEDSKWIVGARDHWNEANARAIANDEAERADLIVVRRRPWERTAAATPWFDVSGGLVGGTVGYNSQFDRIWVFGLEGDLSLVTAGGHAQQIPPFLATQVASTKEDWLGTTRARVGITPAERWLVYASGGLAIAGVEASISPSTFGSESHVRAGWTAGGGIETAITDKVSAKLEYLHVGLENHAYFVPTPNIPNVTNRAGGVPLDDEIVRVGINYKFDWLTNDWTVRVIGVITLTPYDLWRRTHAVHHATSGHLGRRGMGDVDTLTVRDIASVHGGAAWNIGSIVVRW